MTESRNAQNTRQPPLLNACDLCHYKKIRCDRNDPCGHCSNADVECLRQRPRMVSEPRQKLERDRIDLVLERMSRLEESMWRPAPVPTPVVPDVPAALLTPTQSDTSFQPQRMSSETLVAAPESTASPIEKPFPVMPRRKRRAQSILRSPQESRKRSSPQQQQQLQQEQEHSEDEEDEGGQENSPASVESVVDLERYFASSNQWDVTDPQRQDLLASALRLAKQLGSSEPVHYTRDTHPDIKPKVYKSSLYPSAEMVCVILNEYSKNNSLTYYLDINANLPKAEMERMAFALIDHTVHGQARLQYIICVNYVAYTVLADYHGSSSGVNRHLRALRKKYRDNVLVVLNHLDTSFRLDPTLLRALLSAAMLLQDIGLMRRCWELNTAACRICTALSGHYTSDVAAERQSDDVFEMQLLFIKCYIYDRALSANMNQPSCSAEIQLDPSILRTERPSHAMLTIMLQLAGVQDVIVRTTRAWASTRQVKAFDIDKIRGLRQQMRQIRHRVEEFRSQTSDSEDGFMSYEWISVDCIFSSMMTSIIRLSTRPDDRQGYHECLANARSSLSNLKSMLDFATSPGPCLDKCINGLAWLVPLYPLRPIFLLYRNVVVTSNALDFRLLTDVSGSLESLSKSHHSIMAITQLCNSLFTLYRDFMDKAISTRPSPPLDGMKRRFHPVQENQLQNQAAMGMTGNNLRMYRRPDELGRDITQRGNNVLYDNQILDMHAPMLQNPLDYEFDWDFSYTQGSLDWLSKDLQGPVLDLFPNL